MSRRIFPKVLLVAVAIFGVLVLSNVLLAQGYSQEALERVKEVQERHTAHLLAIKGVEGTAIGFNENNRLTVKVFVTRWDVAGIPKKLDDVPVQLVVTGKFYALPRPVPPLCQEKKKGKIDPTARFDRPVPIGVSTGHPDISAGTIGCRLTDGNNVYALSNNHVYADENKAQIGDNVLQPGTYDGGTDPTDAIGTLYAFQSIVFGGGDNTIDAAIAHSDTASLSNATPSDGYGTPKSATIPADLDLLNQRVKKYGQTTGLTKGRVYAIYADVNVVYDSGVAHFVDQIVIRPGPFSAGGDSGSLVVLDGKGKSRGDDRKAVGLLFAGSRQFTIANPIEEVLTSFGVTIDGD
jgi:hypothetical protein